MSEPQPLVALIRRHVERLAASRYASSTIRGRYRDLSEFADWCARRRLRHPRDMTIADLDGYQCAVFSSRRADGAPLGIGSLTQKLLAVKQFLRWAFRLRLIRRDVGSHIELPRRPQSLPRTVLTQTEVEQVLSAVSLSAGSGVRDRTMLEVLYSTGLRRLELIRLAMGDVDPARGLVFVREGKGGRDRVVPIGTRALRWLHHYVTHVRPSHAPAADPGNLFLTRRGRPLRPNRLTELVHRHIANASIGKTGSCHLFRHTMATLMLEHGADIRFVQEMLGHAQLTTTQLYTRVSVAQLKAVHERTHPGR